MTANPKSESESTDKEKSVCSKCQQN